MERPATKFIQLTSYSTDMFLSAISAHIRLIVPILDIFYHFIKRFLHIFLPKYYLFVNIFIKVSIDTRR